MLSRWHYHWLACRYPKIATIRLSAQDLFVLGIVAATNLAWATPFCYTHFLLDRSDLSFILLRDRCSISLTIVDDPATRHLLTDANTFFIKLTLRVVGVGEIGITFRDCQSTVGSPVYCVVVS